MTQPLVLTSAIRSWKVILVAAWFLAAWIPAAFPQDGKGCAGVQYSKKPFAQYSPEKLQQRIQQDPSDVDALVNLGIRLEEQDQIAEAKALYERAIKAKPDCYLGYYFAGLVEERISGRTASDAEAKIRKALSLNTSLRNDGNVEGFMKRHPELMGRVAPKEKETPSDTKQILATGSRFSIGLGVGVLLATLVFYLARLRQTAHR